MGVIILKINIKLLIICIAIPLLVGGASAFITMGAMEDFMKLEQPPLSPPAWLFPVVWTVLYTLMGISLYLIINANPPQELLNKAIFIFSAQLLFNFFWSFWFFGLNLFYFSFAWILALWVLIILMIIDFRKISKTAAYLNIPYLLWVTFAAYLNLGVAILN